MASRCFERSSSYATGSVRKLGTSVDAASIYRSITPRLDVQFRTNRAPTPSSSPTTRTRCADASPYSLGGSIWSEDRDRAYALVSRMETGTVWINRHLDILPYFPFGGAKSSGIGRELGGCGENSPRRPPAGQPRGGTPRGCCGWPRGWRRQSFSPFARYEILRDCTHRAFNHAR